MLVITVLAGPNQGSVYRLREDEDHVIGRRFGSVALADQSMSRQHAELMCDEGVWTIRDLKSQAGVYLDGEKVEGKAEIVSGQQVGVGASEFLFQVVTGGKREQYANMVVEDGGSVKGKTGSIEKAAKGPAEDVREHYKLLQKILGRLEVMADGMEEVMGGKKEEHRKKVHEKLAGLAEQVEGVALAMGEAEGATQKVIGEKLEKLEGVLTAAAEKEKVMQESEGDDERMAELREVVDRIAERVDGLSNAEDKVEKEEMGVADAERGRRIVSEEKLDRLIELVETTTNGRLDEKFGEVLDAIRKRDAKNLEETGKREEAGQVELERGIGEDEIGRLMEAIEGLGEKVDARPLVNQVLVAIERLGNGGGNGNGGGVLGELKQKIDALAENLEGKTGEESSGDEQWAARLQAAVDGLPGRLAEQPIFKDLADRLIHGDPAARRPAHEMKQKLDQIHQVLLDARSGGVTLKDVEGLKEIIREAMEKAEASQAEVSKKLTEDMSGVAEQVSGVAEGLAGIGQQLNEKTDDRVMEKLGDAEKRLAVMEEGIAKRAGREDVAELAETVKEIAARVEGVGSSVEGMGVKGELDSMGEKLSGLIQKMEEAEAREGEIGQDDSQAEAEGAMRAGLDEMKKRLEAIEGILHEVAGQGEVTLPDDFARREEVAELKAVVERMRDALREVESSRKETMGDIKDRLEEMMGRLGERESDVDEDRGVDVQEVVEGVVAGMRERLPEGLGDMGGLSEKLDELLLEIRTQPDGDGSEDSRGEEVRQIVEALRDEISGLKAGDSETDVKEELKAVREVLERLAEGLRINNGDRSGDSPSARDNGETERIQESIDGLADVVGKMSTEALERKVDELLAKSGEWSSPSSEDVPPTSQHGAGEEAIRVELDGEGVLRERMDDVMAAIGTLAEMMAEQAGHVAGRQQMEEELAELVKALTNDRGDEIEGKLDEVVERLEGLKASHEALKAKEEERDRRDADRDDTSTVVQESAREPSAVEEHIENMLADILEAVHEAKATGAGRNGGSGGGEVLNGDEDRLLLERILKELQQRDDSKVQGLLQNAIEKMSQPIEPVVDMASVVDGVKEAVANRSDRGTIDLLRQIVEHLQALPQKLEQDKHLAEIFVVLRTIEQQQERQAQRIRQLMDQLRGEGGGEGLGLEL